MKLISVVKFNDENNHSLADLIIGSEIWLVVFHCSENSSHISRK
jgi:hypothetical protein